MAARVQASSGRRNARRNTRPMYGNDYTQGSAASKLGPQSALKQETRQGKSPSSQSVRSNHRVRRNRERVMYMDLPCVIMPIVAFVLTLYFCINYLHVQSSITARMYHIEKMEAELEQFRVENDALKTSISTSINFNKIYETAIKELGMVYIKKNQVLLYDKTESEYVRQYEDTPEH